MHGGVLTHLEAKGLIHAQVKFFSQPNDASIVSSSMCELARIRMAGNYILISRDKRARDSWPCNYPWKMNPPLAISGAACCEISAAATKRARGGEPARVPPAPFHKTRGNAITRGYELRV